MLTTRISKQLYPSDEPSVKNSAESDVTVRTVAAVRGEAPAAAAAVHRTRDDEGPRLCDADSVDTRCETDGPRAITIAHKKPITANHTRTYTQQIRPCPNLVRRYNLA